MTTTMESLLRDLRLTSRSLRRNPVFAIVSVLTLALGIGATTTVFSVVYGVLFRPLPFPYADRLVQIVQTVRAPREPKPFRAGLTDDQFVNLQEFATTLDAVGSWGHAPATLRLPTISVRLNGGAISAGVLEGLGVQPVLGRTLHRQDSEPGAERIVLLSYQTWRRYLGSRRDIVDTRIDLEGIPTRVVGVMPESFTFPSLASPTMTRNSEGELEDAPEFWVPIHRYERPVGAAGGFTLWQAFAMVKSGVSVEQAEAQVRSVLGSLPPGWTSRIELVSARNEIGRPLSRTLMIFQLGVTLILVIACVNVINLLLARASGRRRELAIRMALGASRGRILREGIAEALLLSLVGGAGGCIITYGLNAALQVLPPHVLPRLRDIRVDTVVLAFVMGLSVVNGLAIGLLSAWRSSRLNGIDSLHQRTLRGGTSNRHAQIRPSSVLVIVEIAAAVVLLTSASLLVRSFVRLAAVDLGYEPKGLLTFKVSLPSTRYPNSETRYRFYDELAAGIGGLPGVVSVSGAERGLSGSPIGSYPLYVDGNVVPGGNQEIRYRGVSPDYFRTLSVPIVEGREFRRDDRAPTATQVVINTAFARRYLAGRSPIGRRIRYSNWQLEIIGVAADTRDRPDQPGNPTLFMPATYSGFLREIVMFVRTVRDPSATLAAARAVVTRIDPLVAPYDGADVEEMIAHSSASPRLYSLVSFCCGAIALLLAMIGLFGVLAYSVGSRTHEFGIRMALGAERRLVMWQVLRNGVWLTCIGLVVGLAGSYAAARGLSTLLFGVTPGDAASFAGTASLLLITTLLACYIPSRRATDIDPVVALRSE
jgi:putative ABC transport system permease protein